MAVTATSSAGAKPETDTVLHAPLLGSVLERLREGGRWVILDLGPAQPGNLGLFRGFRCRLTVADALAELEVVGRETELDEKVLAGRLARVVPDPGKNPWDLVLCWDAPNYLSRPVLKGLMRHIGAHLRPGSLVHAFVESSRASMAPSPGVYSLLALDRLQRLGPLEPSRPSPRYSHWDLHQCWPDLTAEKSVLLKSGLQEYLFRYQ